MQDVCEGPEGLTWLVLDHLQRLEPLSVSCGLQEDDPSIGHSQPAGHGAHRPRKPALHVARSVRVCPLCCGPECAVAAGVLCHCLTPMALKQNHWPGRLLGLLVLWPLHSTPSSGTRSMSPCPPALESSQAVALAPPEVWEVAPCHHASVDCHLDLGLGSWPWQTLVLVTRPCSLQVEVFGKKVTGLKHPRLGHLELPTTPYIPEPTGTPSGAFRQVVSPLDCPQEKPSFPTTDSGRSTARTQAAPHPLPRPGHPCRLTGFAVLIDLGGIKDTA